MPKFILCTEPIPQLIEHNLSDDELKTLAQVTLNWGMAEIMVGTTLAWLYDLKGAQATDLVNGMSFYRKIELMEKLSKAGKLSKSAINLLGDLKFAFNNFKDDRNVFSHGMTCVGPDGTRTAVTATGKTADPDKLPLALEQSKYVLFVANRLLSAATGSEEQALPPLPEKPRGEFVP
jgi:hypothetical protein